MTTEAEQLLENNLVAQLQKLGYENVQVSDEKALLANLKTQLEKHNKTELSDSDFSQILNYINKGNIFERAKILRDRVPYINDTGENKTIELINQTHLCKNEFQVTQQVTIEGKYINRYDVTLLINGLPLVQIELKRRGLELKEAFNQVNRYERHSYGAGVGLFQFIQLFVISNGVNTKYFANTTLKSRSFKQTFYWSDKENKQIRQLSEFADVFLEPCHVSKMITRYIVLNESANVLMVLRPYQYFAVEAIIDRVKNTTKNGFIWHTTGSGKTLTSFKASQILTQMPEVCKVVFVVDRKDLDYQTTKEFNAFSKGSIDGTNNTSTLVDQLSGDSKLIVTTIQKLNTAISKVRYLGKMEDLREKRVVFIFDECHRSQFGKTHEDIKQFFQGAQMFGFTGTPIFEENAGTNEFGKRTTAMLFGGDKALHKYVITDAIRDENVLKFSIEYINTFKKKEDIDDIKIEAIDEQEVMEAPERLDAVVKYIVDNHSRKTHNKRYTAIMCVSSVDVLIQYYQLFKKKQSGLRVATIFSYQANEEDKDAVGDTWSELDDELGMAAAPELVYNSKHTREHLDAFIGDYNSMFGTNYSTKDSRDFYSYYNDIAKKVKNQQIDVLLVVNMFLTGFDSKHLNTIYVDKNLKYHGLIQAYSRTNRILDEMKSQGNVVCFRNLKKATDDAISLFSNINAKDEIILEPYEVYVDKMNAAYIALLQVVPTVKKVSELESEEDELRFAKAFREVMRTLNVLKTFTEFKFEDVSLNEQTFEDFKSAYLDLRDKVKRDSGGKEKTSILNDIDFELELIHRDEINVKYILQLLAKLNDALPTEGPDQTKKIIDLVSGDVKLRSKRDLIEKFIQDHLPLIEDSEDVPDRFMQFMSEEREKAIHSFSQEEDLDEGRLEKVIGEYLFTEKPPLRDDIIGAMNSRPALKERKTKTERVISKIKEFVETFINGVEL